jgi:hypothetical protein
MATYKTKQSQPKRKTSQLHKSTRKKLIRTASKKKASTKQQPLMRIPQSWN